MKYKTVEELYREAEKARDWYNCKGMKVAKSPSMPSVVATWLLFHLPEPAKTVGE